MRFHLLDRVTQADDHTLVATKCVTLAEEYLGDHFPAFPVLPGVLMLEAATQAAAWVVFRRAGLLDATDTYTGPTVAVLKSVRNLRYGHFVAPGRTLTVRVTATGEDAFDAAGTVDAPGGETTAITGKIVLAALRVPDDPAANDALVLAHRARWKTLRTASGVALASGTGGT